MCVNCRTLEHQKAIERKYDRNTFSKHLMTHHPEEGNTGSYQYCLAELHSQSLPRLASESCYIHINNVEIAMDSKARVAPACGGQISGGAQGAKGRQCEEKGWSGGAEGGGAIGSQEEGEQG